MYIHTYTHTYIHIYIYLLLVYRVFSNLSIDSDSEATTGYPLISLQTREIFSFNTRSVILTTIFGN